jgi:hypothetical protein
MKTKFVALFINSDRSLILTIVIPRVNMLYFHKAKGQVIVYKSIIANNSTGLFYAQRNVKNKVRISRAFSLLSIAPLFTFHIINVILNVHLHT